MALGSTNFPEHHENEFMKRGYLLPDGCKDLTEAIKLKEQQRLRATSLPHAFTKAKASVSIVSEPHPLPPAKGIIIIDKRMTIYRLAMMLGQNALPFISDLLKAGAISKSETASIEKVVLDFIVISFVARKYGFVAQMQVE